MVLHMLKIYEMKRNRFTNPISVKLSINRLKLLKQYVSEKGKKKQSKKRQKTKLFSIGAHRTTLYRHKRKDIVSKI